MTEDQIQDHLNRELSPAERALNVLEDAKFYEDDVPEYEQAIITLTEEGVDKETIFQAAHDLGLSENESFYAACEIFTE
jgi:hypothetical protein